jgi:metallo-beta-lactamase family protein
MDIRFLGATETVTGSKYLLRADGRNLLVDCGLFQGLKSLRLRNWARLPIRPKQIDAVLMTHAHLDHSGYLPLLVKNGFNGPVYASSGTRDLCGVLLPDAGHLQEEEAYYANKYGFSKHKPALPLFTEEDAIASLKQIDAVPFEKSFEIGGTFRVRLSPAGHLLGASIATVECGGVKVVFSGDLGRQHDPLMHPPTVIEEADYLVVESTYGNRLHDTADPEEQLAVAVKRAAHRGGVVIIPAFAVGRAQSLLYYLSRLKASKAIPDIPVYLNSPMAVNATRLYQRHHAEHRLTEAQCREAFAVARTINSVEESRALNERRGPMIIISASGMATGGRVLHHLKAFAPDPRNMIILAGFQAAGTRGASLAEGAPSIKIHGAYVPVRAEVVKMDCLSAHADYAEIMSWLGNFKRPPRQTFVTHGEPAAADELRRRIVETLGWKVSVPAYQDEATLV